MIVDALAARYGGTAYAAVQTSRRLAGDPEVGRLLVVARRGSVVAQGAGGRPGLRLIELRRARRLELPRRVAWLALRLPRLVRAEGATSVLTWSGMLPRRLPAAVVCYLSNPVMFESPDVVDRVRRWAAGRTVRRAAAVLAPSEAMATLVERAFGRRPEVVPLGIDHERFRPPERAGDEVLCVADFYRHKRHDLLLEAWAALPAPRPSLRLVGDSRVDPGHYRDLRRAVERLRDRGEIVVESGLSLGGLIAAYHRARVLALPSEHESFCLPLLEAQACGVPAVVRDLPALRETGGEAATYLRSDAPGDWAEALGRLLHDEASHRAARSAGLDSARRFSWERTAAAIRARLLAAARGPTGA